MTKSITFRLLMTLLMGCGLIVMAAGDVDAAEAGKDETKHVKVKDITLNVPVAWKQRPPANKLRLAQFDIPPEDGDREKVELTIFSFGGGGVGANVRRWINQFQPDSRKVKITTGKSPQGPYVFVDLSGTFNMPVGPPIQRKTKPLSNARMLGVILAVEKKGVYYLKMAGPKKTISASTDALRSSFGATAGNEKDFKLDDGN